MDKKHVGIIVLAIIIIIGGISFYFLYDHSSVLPKNNQNNLTTLPDISAPVGWYAHRLNNANIIFTKQQNLPQVSGTEEYAYGEQINVSAVPVNGSLEDWANVNLGDNVVAPSKQWSAINGHQVVSTEVDGEAGKMLDYAVFSTSAAYVFFLYPEDASDTAVLTNMVDSFAMSL